MKKYILILSILLFFSPAFAFNEQIDSVRNELGCAKDKNSKEYAKLEAKLNKLLTKNNINYTNSARLEDAERLINEKKYNAASWELNELLKQKYQESRCLELKADICEKSTKDDSRAYVLYRQALELDKQNSYAYFKLGKLCIKNKKTALGVEYLTQAVETAQDDKLIDEIAKYIDENNVENNLDKSNLYDILGQIYIRQNNKTKAVEAYTKALELNPQDIDLRYRLANILDYNDDYAIEIYNSILKEYPEDSQIRSSKADLLFKEGKFQSANQEYGTILALYPNSNQAKYGIYKLYEYKLPVEKIIPKFYENNPKHIPEKKEIKDFINFLNEIGDSEAAKNFENYLDNKKIAPVEKKVEKTPVKTQSKPQQQATATKDSLDDVKKIQNENALAQKELEANAKSSKYLKFKPQIESYMKTPEKTSDIYIAIANTYKLASMPYNSLKYYREAKKLNPINSDIYFNIGLTYLELNNLQSAKDNLQRAIDLDKNNKKAYNLMGFVNQKIITHIINESYTKFSNKKYVEAFEILDNGIKKFPRSAQMYFYRAQVFEAMNRNAGAIIDLQKAVELDGSYYMAYYELGKLYEKIKDDKSALVAYERFLSTEPQEKDLVDEVQKKVISLGKKYY